MKIVHMVMFLVAVAVLGSCAPSSDVSSEPLSVASDERGVIEGVVTGISGTHGNVYTSIHPDQYESLGLAVGGRVVVMVADQELELPIGRDYADVPTGASLAVLHREGLTFAIRDGNFSRTYGVNAGMPFSMTVTAQR